MLQLQYTGSDLVIEAGNKKSVVFHTTDQTVEIDGIDVSFPGEYEKGGILGEVKEYLDTLFYIFSIEGKRLCIVTSDSFELREEILKFFGDVDILVIVGTKGAAKVFESIEAKVVVPYGEGTAVFLNTLGQHVEPVANYKIKAELPIDTTEFVHLEMS